MTIIKNTYHQAKSFGRDPENGRNTIGSSNESLEPLTVPSDEIAPNQEPGKTWSGVRKCLIVLLTGILMFYMVLSIYNNLHYIQELETRKDQLGHLKLDSNGDLVLDTSDDYDFANALLKRRKLKDFLAREQQQDMATLEKYQFDKNFYEFLNNYDPMLSLKKPKSSVNIVKAGLGSTHRLDDSEFEEEISMLHESGSRDSQQSRETDVDANFVNAKNLLDSIKHNVDTFKIMLDKEFPEESKITESMKISPEPEIYESEQPIDSDIDQSSDREMLAEEYPADSENADKHSTDSELSNSEHCTNIPVNFRFDCHPEDHASESSCQERGCCWAPIDTSKCDQDGCSKQVPLNVPYCYYPDNWPTYNSINETRHDGVTTVFAKRDISSYYKNDIRIIKMEYSSPYDSVVRVKISDPANPRYEPPWPARSEEKPLRDIREAGFILETEVSKPGFKVKRADDQTVLFDTMLGVGTIFSDQFLQVSSLLPSHDIYGLGEHLTHLKLNTNWQSFTMFNADQAPIEQANLYGSHPFYLVRDTSGRWSGTLFLNSNAMDIILQPTPAITLRSIGGIFDFYIFIGPTPTDVLRQYSKIIGKPFMPPYWSLGFHLCRFGYGSLDKTKEVWNRTRNAKIPFDTQWNDLDYMDRRNDFTYDKDKFRELPKFIDELHNAGMRYIPLIDAGVSGSEPNGSYPPYDEGIRLDIFVKDGVTGLPFVGKVWNLGSTVWPDFTNPKTNDYYTMMMQKMHNDFAYDGAWIDMNEPSNFYNGESNGCPLNDLDNPEYVPNIRGGLLAAKTMCMNAKHYKGSHYDLHNTYGTSQAVATNYALTTIRQKRPFIISRSTWEGHGFYAGHWTGDVYSTWDHLKLSIPAILANSLFHIPMVGADICGFNGNTTESLCNRWMQLGAFYPFSRNHNSDDTIEQDPVAMGDLVVKSSRKALMIRYRFLPYLYTLFFKAHRFGDTVARPLFFEFIDDPATCNIDTQFLWGSSFMIIPVLEENKIEVTAYIPRGLWYDFYTKASIMSTGQNVTLKAPLDTIPLLIRGGSILPAQTPGTTTTASRKNKFELLVALNENRTAYGEIYWDDGDSLDTMEKMQYRWIAFTLKDDVLTNSEIEKGLFDEDMILGKVSVMGIDKNVDRVTLNGNDIGFSYDSPRNYLNIKGLSVDLKKDFTLSWSYK